MKLDIYSRETIEKMNNYEIIAKNKYETIDKLFARLYSMYYTC